MSGSRPTDTRQSRCKPAKLKPLRKVVQVGKEELCLVCNWDYCGEVLGQMSEFTDHVLIKHIDPMPADIGECLWLNCNHRADSKDELVRHLYYHAHHTKIKSIGGNLLTRAGMMNCSVDSQARNLIPELHEDLSCLWQNCKDKFNDPEFYYRHVNDHAVALGARGNNPVGGAMCQWEGCANKFLNQHKLIDHLRSHTQEKRAACPNCGGFFANRTKLFDHIKRQLPQELQNYQCSHCSKKCSSERLLRDHMRTHVNHYKCPYCDMTCLSPSSLNNHVKYRHADEKPFNCEFCEYQAKSLSDLRKHMLIHDVDPPYKCSYPECNHTSRGHTSMMAHVQKVHQGGQAHRYKCHICNGTFLRGTYLTKHLMKQHKYCWPSGHSRFRYKCDEDGFFRLQTKRFESVELTQKMIDDDDEVDKDETSNSDSLERASKMTEDEIDREVESYPKIASSTPTMKSSEISKETFSYIPVVMEESDGTLILTYQHDENRNDQTFSDNVDLQVLVDENMMDEGVKRTIQIHLT